MEPSGVAKGAGEATLEQVLQAREDRARRQRELLSRLPGPLVSFTMNIPGPVKNTALVRFAFRAGLCRLEERLGEPLHLQCLCQSAGCEALLGFAGPAEALKAACLSLEEEGEIGRLYDLDVLTEAGEKLSRGTPRPCLLCGGPAALCARDRAHGLRALTARTEEILRAFAGAHLASLAEEALLAEADFTPKPGLVDRRGSGAHRDMDLSLFRRSALALAPHLRRFAVLGMDRAAPAELQAAGRQAEEAMFAATGGVNTHKGAVYSLSLLLWGAGRALTEGGGVLASAAEAAAALPPAEGTHGSAVRRRYGLEGARGEAVGGFPHLRRCREVLEREGALSALLWSMACLKDTNLYYRGGAEGALFVRQAAARILSAPAGRREALAVELDGALIQKGLSPGGSADLLALSLFCQSLSRRMDPEALA